MGAIYSSQVVTASFRAVHCWVATRLPGKRKPRWFSDAKRLIDCSGIGCEPASGASVAGLKILAANRIIDKDETALCVLTGHILKDFGTFLDYDN